MDIRDKNGLTESEFLEAYAKTNYPRPCLTADVVVFSKDKDKVLLIKRGGHPFIEHWAFPGGFVNQTEDAETAALRELEEETGLKGVKATSDIVGSENEAVYFEEIGLFSKPGRDPRGWIVSDAYVAVLPTDEVFVEGGDDAQVAQWFKIEKDGADIVLINGDIKIRAEDLAFDHFEVLKKALRKIG